jgi:hypothetical protein
MRLYPLVFCTLLRIPLFFALLMPLMGGPLLAQPVWEEQLLLAPDGTPNDQFGSSVATDGHRFVVGAPQDFAPGSSSGGSAYVWTPSDTGWQVAKLLPTDSASSFGEAVAIAGDRVLVAAPRDSNANGQEAGAVFLYTYNGTAWQGQRFLAPDGVAGDHFGKSVAIGGNRFVVGAPHDVGLPHFALDTGHVYRYDWNGATWQPTRLIAPAPFARDWFGKSVALGPDRLAVGCPWAYNAFFSSTGGIALYEWQGGTWQDTLLFANDGAANDLMGYYVALDGNQVVATALQDDNTKGQLAGSIYAFAHKSGGWQQTAKLLASDGQPSDLWGRHPSLAGQRLVVGRGNAGNALGSFAGQVYRFTQDSAGWQDTIMLASNGQPYDFYGAQAATAGSWIVVGAANHTNVNGQSAGAVYHYRCLVYDTLTAEACLSYTPPSGDTVYTQSGLYQDTLTQAGACDTVFTLALTIKGVAHLTRCDSFRWNATNQTYYSSGTYSDSTGSPELCDGQRRLYLTLGHSNTYSLDTLLPHGQALVMNGRSYDSAGTYRDTLTNTAGCDSVLTITLRRPDPSDTTTLRPGASGPMPLRLFPNPAVSGVELAWDKPGAYRHARLLTLSGRALGQWQFRPGQRTAYLALGHMPRGLYVLALQGAAGRVFRRLCLH